MGIFEKDLAASTLLAVPELYTNGQRDGSFNLWVYLGWMFMAATESMILYFIMFSLFGNILFTTDNSLFAMGDLVFVACIFVISLKMQFIEMHNKSIMAAGSFVLSIGAVFLWNIILAGIYPNDKIYHVRHAFFDGFGKNPLWWFVLILSIVCVTMFEMSVTVLRRTYFPTDADRFQELEKDLEIRKRFEEASAMELRQGWDRGQKKSSFELRREAEVQAILNARPGGGPSRQGSSTSAARRLSQELESRFRTVTTEEFVIKPKK
jgi:phospholipid-translocating ATPase